MGKNFILDAHDFIHVVVDRKDIETNDINPVLKVLNTLLNKEMTKKYCGRVDLSITGYDDDPRELWEFKEVCSWLKSLDAHFPYWFFFLSLDGIGLNLVTLTLCGAKEVQSGLASYDKKIFNEFLNTHFAAMCKICNTVGFTQEEVDKLGFKVMNYYQGRH